MRRFEKLKKRYNDCLYNHLWLMYLSDWGFAFIVTAFSAAIFAFGINVFLAPSVPGVEIAEMVSGGSSGAAQVIDSFFKLNGIVIKGNESLIFSIAYLMVNAPLVILAFKGIGKRFASFTLINVLLVFLFTNLFHGQIFSDVARFVHENGGMLARALFAGLCTGVSSAIAFKIESSAGGFDILSYYLSTKKSTLAGKYGVIINFIVISSFSLVNIIGYGKTAQGISLIWFSLVYLLTVMLVIDVINIRNKKAQIQIITTKQNLAKLLLANIPHGATVLNARGAYSDKDQFVVYMVVSTTEIKKAVKVIQQLDPGSFINVTSLHQVYGHFYMKPIK